MAKLHKKKSKNITCRKRYKIERKVREHHRKVRKESKKNPHKKKRKDPGVPNSYPFKDEILKEAEERKRKAEEEKEKLKERRKQNRAKLVDKKRSLQSMVTDAAKRASQFEQMEADKSESPATEYNGGKALETSRKAFVKEFKKVIENADVILEVLDARDPLGSRCPQVEEAVMAAGHNKKLVLVLNKIDLVPKESVELWLKYLRNEFPTIAFKASTQTQKENLSHSRVPVQLASEVLTKSARCLGADMLMKLLGNYCRSQDIKTSITVGVIGFPNTGKSSIINSLKRSKACDVGGVPGVTRSMQEVHLDKHIKLLDSPGIVMAHGTSDTAMILKNCVKIEALDDPIPSVEAILKRCSKEKMMVHYNIPDYSDVHGFLALMAARMGRLKKHGIPDINRAARSVLQDWNSGKITYYTQPPEEHTLPTHLSAELVQQMAAEFDIDALTKDEQEALKGLKITSSSDIVINSSGMTDGLAEVDNAEEDEVSDMEEEGPAGNKVDSSELKDVTVSFETAKTRTKSITSVQVDAKKKVNVEMQIAGNQQQNKDRKKAFKHMKKQRKRADVVATDLSNIFTSAFDTLSGVILKADDDYNFETDYK